MKYAMIGTMIAALGLTLSNAAVAQTDDGNHDITVELHVLRDTPAGRRSTSCLRVRKSKVQERSDTHRCPGERQQSRSRHYQPSRSLQTCSRRAEIPERTTRI